jgi:hypothetical protein
VVPLVDFLALLRHLIRQRVLVLPPGAEGLHQSLAAIAR